MARSLFIVAVFLCLPLFALGSEQPEAAARALRAAVPLLCTENNLAFRTFVRGTGVIADSAGTPLETEIDMKNFTWLAARCNLQPETTIRFAHTSPLYLTGEKQNWDASEDKAYFVKWIDDLIAQSNADPNRFPNVDQKNEVLGIYNTARAAYGG